MSGWWAKRPVRVVLLLALLLVWALVLVASWRDGDRDARTAAPLAHASAPVPAAAAPRAASAPQR